MFKHEKKKQNKFGLMAVLMMVTPLVLAGIVACYYYLRNNGMSWIPALKWNDEAAYYQLIKTCITTGQPLGYWGFNGNQAIVGTGSAWSPAIIWPYAIWAYIFPLSKGFVYFVNLFYIVLANFIFYCCVKPDRRQCLKLALAQATSAVFVLYLSVNMSEMLRFAIAIVIAGLLYKIMFGSASKLMKYFITPFVIIWATQVYVFFAFCVPIYVFAIMKEKQLWKKILVAGGSTCVVAFGSYYLLHLISSNYNIHKTEALLSAVKSMDIVGAVMAFLRMMKQGALDVFHLWTYVYTNPLIPFHVLFGGFLVLISLGILLKFWWRGKKKTDKSKGASKRKRKVVDALSHDSVIALIVCYGIVLFYLMYMTLYSIDPFTFMRGTYIVIIFSMYFMAMLERKSIYFIIIGVQAISLLFLPVNMDYYMSNHYMSREENAEWENLENSVSAVIIPDENKDAWGNTVAMYTMEPKAICSIPAGAGVNFIMEDGILPEDAEYLYFSLVPAEEQNSEWLVRDYEAFCRQFADILAADYEVIYNNGEYIIYQKNRT